MKKEAFPAWEETMECGCSKKVIRDSVTGHVTGTMVTACPEAQENWTDFYTHAREQGISLFDVHP